MKKIIVLINLIFLNQFSLFSQEDKLALDLLNSMSDNYKKMKGFTSSFTYSMKNLTEDITDSFSGKISVKDDKYVLFIEGQKIINDSKTVWTYLEDLNEVTISEFDPSEQDISINNVFEVYKEGYKHKFIKKTNGVNTVEIYPEDENKSYFKISFAILENDLLSSFTELNEVEDFRVLEDISEKKIGDLICKHPLFLLGFEYDVKVFPSNHVTN